MSFGDSGCGKTSLLRVLSGLDKQDIGEIYINEEPISSGMINIPPESQANQSNFPRLCIISSHDCVSKYCIWVKRFK